MVLCVFCFIEAFEVERFLPLPSEDSYFKAFGPKDHII